MQPTSNVNNFFGQKVSQPGIPVNKANDSQLLYKNDFSTQTFYDQFGNAQVVIGLQIDGSYGFRAALPNNDANTSNNLAFNSTQISGQLKYPAITVAAGSAVDYLYYDEIAHNYGFVPPFTLYGYNPIGVYENLSPGTVSPGGYQQLISGTTITLTTASTTSSKYTPSFVMDNNNLYLSVDIALVPASAGVTSLPFTIQYYIPQQALPSGGTNATFIDHN
jgi:hypothetical protein